jgi:hypothetical protein
MCMTKTEKDSKKQRWTTIIVVFYVVERLV